LSFETPALHQRFSSCSVCVCVCVWEGGGGFRYKRNVLCLLHIWLSLAISSISS